MIDIFLKDLQYYRTFNGVEDASNFLRECDDFSQLQQVFDVLHDYKDYMRAMKNSTLVKVGGISKQNKKRCDSENIVDFVNKLILDKYTTVLVHCGWEVCVTGLVSVPESCLSIKNTSCCWNLSNEIFIVKKI